MTDRWRCRSIPTNCLPSYSSIGASYDSWNVDTPASAGNVTRSGGPAPSSHQVGDAADADDLLRALTGSWRPKLERWPGGYTTNLTTGPRSSSSMSITSCGASRRVSECPSMACRPGRSITTPASPSRSQQPQDPVPGEGLPNPLRHGEMLTAAVDTPRLFRAVPCTPHEVPSQCARITPSAICCGES